MKIALIIIGLVILIMLAVGVTALKLAYSVPTTALVYAVIFHAVVTAAIGSAYCLVAWSQGRSRER